MCHTPSFLFRSIGTALFGTQQLTYIALEQCDSAQCAVRLMGRLAEKHGFYQDADTPTGESLTVKVSHPFFPFVTSHSTRVSHGILPVCHTHYSPLDTPPILPIDDTAFSPP